MRPTKAIWFMMLSAMPVGALAKTDEQLADAYMNARVAEIANQNEQASLAFGSLLTLRPTSEVLADRLFVTAIRSGNMPAALRAVRAQELSNRAGGDAPLLLFADAFRRNDWKMADIALAELSAKSQFAFAVPILQAWANRAQGKAVNITLGDAEADKFYNFYALDQQIYSQLANVNFDGAEKSLTLFQSIGASYSDNMLIESAMVLASKGRGAVARNLLSGILEPTEIDALVQQNAKSTREIIPAKAIAILHVRFANDLLEQNVPEQAIVQARLAEWYVPGFEQATLALAAAERKLGQPQKALKILQTMKTSSPYWSKTVIEQAQILVDSGQKVAARSLLAKARLRSPDSLAFAQTEARVLMESQAFAEAVSAFRNFLAVAEARQLSVEHRAGIMLELATAMDKAGNWAEARQVLQNGLKLDARNPYLLNYLGYSMLEKGENVAEAKAHLKAASQLAPQSWAISDSLAWAHYHSGEYVQAVELLEKAARKSGEDMTVYEHLGDSYWQIGRNVDARYSWRRAELLASAADAARLKHKIDYGILRQPKKS